MGPGQRLEGWGGVKSKPAEQEVISPQAESTQPAGRRWRGREQQELHGGLPALTLGE